MKNNYIAPQIEVIEIEVESILCASGGSAIENATNSGTVNWSNIS